MVDKELALMAFSMGALEKEARRRGNWWTRNVTPYLRGAASDIGNVGSYIYNKPMSALGSAGKGFVKSPITQGVTRAGQATGQAVDYARKRGLEGMGRDLGWQLAKAKYNVEEGVGGYVEDAFTNRILSPLGRFFEAQRKKTIGTNPSTGQSQSLQDTVKELTAKVKELQAGAFGTHPKTGKPMTVNDLKASMFEEWDKRQRALLGKHKATGQTRTIPQAVQASTSGALGARNVRELLGGNISNILTKQRLGLEKGLGTLATNKLLPYMLMFSVGQPMMQTYFQNLFGSRGGPSYAAPQMAAPRMAAPSFASRFRRLR